MVTTEVARWRLVVPVKGRLSAKSRLHPPPGVHRADLAHAFALDTLAAVCAAIPPEHLVVATSDTMTAAFAVASGASVVADPGDGLNPAVRAGIRHVLAVLGEGPTGVLLGDLPTLTPAALAQALTECARHERSFVPDAEGSGTVLLAALAAQALDPRFGTGSAEAHEAGSTRLDLDLPALRNDVDDDTALRRAVGLGVGPRTRTVLDGGGLA